MEQRRSAAFDSGSRRAFDGLAETLSELVEHDDRSPWYNVFRELRHSLSEINKVIYQNDRVPIELGSQEAIQHV